MTYRTFDHEVYDTLKKINLFKDQYVDWRKGSGGKDLPYLKWGIAWFTLKENFPSATKRFTMYDRPDAAGQTDVQYYADGTASVECTVTIRDGACCVEMTQCLPVYNHSNNAIKNPNADDINTAKQRCMVKTLAMLGLGLNIYMGIMEDYQSAEPETKADKAQSPDDGRLFSSIENMPEFFNVALKKMNVGLAEIDEFVFNVTDFDCAEQLPESRLTGLLDHVAANAADFGGIKNV